MKSGSKSRVWRLGRVWVKFVLQSSGFYRVITIGLLSGFSGLVSMIVLNVGFWVGLFYPRVSGYRVPESITTWNVVDKNKNIDYATLQANLCKKSCKMVVVVTFIA